MKLYLSVLFAVVFFIGISVLTLDAVTSHFGKPSRGFSYGVSMYYLAFAISITGSAALILTKWFNPRLTLFFGVFSIFIWVVWLLPHPGFAIKSLVAFAISTTLAIDIIVLWILTKK